MEDDADYDPDDDDGTETEKSTDNNNNEADWREATGAAQLGQTPNYSTALPPINALCNAAASMETTATVPVVPIPFDLLRLKKLKFTKDRAFLIETQQYMQAFAPSDYTPMDGATQSEEELDGILTI